ncbi:hypothetical protein ACTFIZ_006031 [Dictyostelium cf. discoideum]
MESVTTTIQCMGIKDSCNKKKIFQGGKSKIIEIQVKYENSDEVLNFQTTQSAINKLISELKKEIYSINLPISNYSVTSSSALQDINLLCQCISSTPKIQRSLSFVNFIETENNLTVSSTFIFDFIKNSDISGVLLKTKNNNKRTKKERLCVIKYSRVLYYFSETGGGSSNDINSTEVKKKRCKGLKFLDDCKIIEKGENYFQLKTSNNETYVFTTPTNEECDRWVTTINNCIDYITKSTYRVSGQVQGTVIKSRNLAAKDLNGKSDPFVIIKAEQQQHRTQTIYKSLNPQFNEAFHFDITKHQGYVYFFVWDEDKFKTADFMGEVALPLSLLPPNGSEISLWLPLSPRNSKDKVSGDILIKIRYFFSPDQIEVSPTSIYGNSLEAIVKNRPEVCKNQVPNILYQFIEFFEQHLNEEGLFRICGNSTEIKFIKNQINTDTQITFNPSSVHAYAGAFKLFFRELPEPLFTFNQYDNLINLAKKSIELQPLIEIIKTFPICHLNVLKLLLPFFGKIAANSKSNLMNHSNLSIVFGPSFLRVKDESHVNLMEMILVNDIAKFVFENSQQILKSI